MLSAIVVMMHSTLNFYLCYSLSDALRFHRISLFLVCVANALVAPFLLQEAYVNPTIPYLICLFVLTAELCLLFKANISARVGVALGSLLHLFVLRHVIVAALAIAYQKSMFEVMQNDYALVNLLSFAAQLITLTLFIVLIPLKTMRKIMDDKGFYKNLLMLVSLLIVYLIYNAYMFNIPYFSLNLAVQEIVISTLILSFFYIMVLLMIKIFNLGFYEKKTKELEGKIDEDKMITSVVFHYATIILEMNCTKDIINKLVLSGKQMPLEHLAQASSFFSKQVCLFTHPQDVDTVLSMSPAVLVQEYEAGRSEKECEFRSKKIEPAKDNTGVQTVGEEYLWYRMRIKITMVEETGDVIAILTMDEIHSEKQEELELRHRAERDFLTGAYNKSAFSAKLNEYLQEGGEGALYMFDLDNFKSINDNMGHSVGDAVLREIYAEIAMVFRNHDLIGRVGGDEFVVFLMGPVPLAIIEEKAEKLCERMKKTYHAENHVSIEISCSVGIAKAQKDGANFEYLFNAADLAMYQSKSKGKNTYTMYDKTLNIGFTPKKDSRK